MVRAGLAICSLGNVIDCGTRPYFIVGGVRRVWQYAPLGNVINCTGAPRRSYDTRRRCWFY
ncbi:hypothetical protein [Arthrospira platensis]|uniref:hypothetical protein n=1 Tax=Limnospira TaxID=2596745 RepID=UPI0001D0EE28|nr:hypothetical protein [Arthrospira platensis]MDT9311467.1 hypothetical protein [Limnospira sp. Paracas R14]BAI93571.1 hypothetical protein NIES39_O03220 [Arthrospira platensis NIES-39]